MPLKPRSSKPHPALTPNKGKLYKKMLQWHLEFPVIMELFRSQLGDLPIPGGFSWIHHYEGRLWESARAFAVEGVIPPSLNQSLALLWAEPEYLTKRFAHMNKDEFDAFLKDGELDLIEGDPYEFLREIFVVWGKLLAFTRNLECVAIHGKTLNELILRGRTQDAALLDAVRIDPALISHPTFKARISCAAFMNEKAFLVALSTALNPKNLKSRNINTNLSPLRLVIAMMGESGDLEIKPEKVRAFIQNDVGIDYYKDHDPEAFRQAFARAKKEYSATSN